jgi:hypothetical protein
MRDQEQQPRFARPDAEEPHELMPERHLMMKSPMWVSRTVASISSKPISPPAGPERRRGAES